MQVEDGGWKGNNHLFCASDLAGILCYLSDSVTNLSPLCCFKKIFFIGKQPEAR